MNRIKIRWIAYAMTNVKRHMHCIEHGSCLVAGAAVSCSVSIVQKIADDAPCIQCNHFYDTDDGN